jgi:protein SCO1/2
VTILAMRTSLRAAAAAFAVTATALLVAGCSSDDATTDDTPTETSADDGTLSGYTREPTPSVAEVSLPLADGTGVVPASAAPGGLRIVYFGYTSCPDVCPTTMSDVKAALAELPPEDAERVQVVMVTVDPDRDVPEKLTAYVQTFIEDGQASRVTDPAALEAAAAAFGAQYDLRTADSGEVEVSHSADLYVVDDAGDIVLQWPFGTASADIAADLSTLLGGATA